MGAIALVLSSSAAIAEVCDKVAGDAWMPGQAPVRVPELSDLAWLLGVVGLSVVVAVRSKSTAFKIALIGALALISIFQTYVYFIELDGEVVRAAIQEGCYGQYHHIHNLMGTLIFGFLAATCGWLAFRPTKVRGV